MRPVRRGCQDLHVVTIRTDGCVQSRSGATNVDPQRRMPTRPGTPSLVYQTSVSPPERYIPYERVSSYPHNSQLQVDHDGDEAQYDSTRLNSSAIERLTSTVATGRSRRVRGDASLGCARRAARQITAPTQARRSGRVGTTFQMPITAFQLWPPTARETSYP